jgi:hypothetical protein
MTECPINLEKNPMRISTWLADTSDVTSPDSSATAQARRTDMTGYSDMSQHTAQSLSQMLAAPPESPAGWLDDIPTPAVSGFAATASRSFSAADVDNAPRYIAPEDTWSTPAAPVEPRRQSAPSDWEANALSSYTGDSWVPPLLIAPPEFVDGETEAYVPPTKAVRPVFTGFLVGLVAIAGVLLVVPRLTAKPAVDEVLRVAAANATDAHTVPTDDSEAATAAIEAASRRTRTKVYGTEAGVGRTHPAAPTTLNYVTELSPESARLQPPDLLNGVLHTHLTAVTDAAQLASRWPDNAQAKTDLRKAKDGAFALDIWLSPSGDLAKVIISTVDDGSGGQIEITYP